MKNIIACIVFAMIATLVIAQPPKDSKTAPSQADMDKMKKQMADAMKDLPPEARKMMDSMGIKMPDPDKIELPKGMTMDKIQQMQDKMITDNAAYRKKSLAEMPKNILSDAELVTFLQNSFTKVDNTISAKAKINAQKIIAESKSKNVSVEGSAIAAFINKGSQEALWIYAKLANEDPNNSNVLCNYAAVVSMCGGSHLAIPVLNNLNKKYPDNSSVLNNLGQAWLDFGKIDSTQKYLKLAIKKSPYHATANFTMSQVCGSLGEIDNQIAYLKAAIKGGYTEKAEANLKKLGVKVSRKDVDWPFPYNPDPLGLKHFEIPDYPSNTVASDKLEPKWKAFKTTCKAEQAKYEEQAKQLAEVVMQKEKALMAKALAIKKGEIMVSPFAELAGIYFGKDVEDALAKEKKWIEHVVQETAEVNSLQEIASKQGQELDTEMEKKYKGRCPGEGCPVSQYCPDFAEKTNKISNEYLSAANGIKNRNEEDRLEVLRIALNASVNLATYSWVIEEKLQWHAATAKAQYMGALADINYDFRKTVSGDCGIKKDKKEIAVIKLSDFDEINCPVEDKFNLSLGLAKIAITCTKVSVEGGEIVQGSFEADLRSGKFEVGIGLGLTWRIGSGPVDAEYGGKIMGIYQFDETGYTGGGIKVTGGGQFNAGVLSAEDERSATYFINTGSKSPGLTIENEEVSAGFKFH